MSKSESKSQPREEQLMELVQLFESFSQASSTFAQSYHALEERIAELSQQLEQQSRLLERTEGFLSSVLAHVPVGIVVLDMDGTVSLFNEEAERLTGFEAQDVVGRPYNDIFEVDVNEPDSAIYTLTNGTVIESREKNLQLPGQRHTPVRFTTQWIYSDDGRPLGVLEVFEDLRQIRDLQQRMQHSASLAALGEMAAQVAHELRNPLAGVQGFAQFLREDLEEEHPARPVADKILGGVRDIDQIAGRLLEFTRPMSLNVQPVDVIKLLNDELELARAEVERDEKKIEFEFHVPDERVRVQCDGALLKQAVLNLLKNSISATPDGGRVELALRWDLLRNRFRIVVRDSGVGIAGENLPKIFNPFFTTRTKGTGLGLAMVKKITDAHHGTIDVDSEPGRGTRFTMEFPIARNL